MIKVILACADSEARRAQHWATKIANHGMECVLQPFFDAGSVRGHASAAREDQKQLAVEHLVQARCADVFWLLWPNEVYSDATFALGYATACRPGVARIIASGPKVSESPYTSLANFRDPSDAVAFHDLCNAAQRIICARDLKSWGA